MDKKNDCFFLVILILVLISFISLNLIRTIENYLINKLKIKYNLI